MTITDILNFMPQNTTTTLTIKPPNFPIRKVGDKVFDMPSQTIQKIFKVTIHFEEDFVESTGDNEARCLHTFVHYDVSGLTNPTGDGAFPGHSRNDFEVCDPDKTLPLQY